MIVLKVSAVRVLDLALSRVYSVGCQMQSLGFQFSSNFSPVGLHTWQHALRAWSNFRRLSTVKGKGGEMGHEWTCERLL